MPEIESARTGDARLSRSGLLERVTLGLGGVPATGAEAFLYPIDTPS